MCMLQFLRGDPLLPSGNLLAFVHVDGHNPVEPGCPIILCNIVVSFIIAEKDFFPAVVFPPVGLDSEQKLEQLAEINPHYDIIRLEDFCFPSEKEAENYLRMRIRQFNDMVMEYVEICHDYTNAHSFLSKDLMGSITTPSDVFLNHLPTPFHQEQIAPLGDTNAPVPMEEQYCLEQLNACFELYKTAATKAKRTVPYFKRVISVIEKKYPHYDVDNFAKALGLYNLPIKTKKVAAKKTSKRKTIPTMQTKIPQTPTRINKKTRNTKKKNMGNLQLARLYLHKFQAIYDERYEDAAHIQDCIRGLEINKKLS